ncbi:MAG: MFS transporter [Ktedonobacteraceae bacterium]|nr:MFS transporter [Ktedonobacteraceae bacterium]
MQEEQPGLIPTRGVAAPTANGYEVPEGKGELVNRNSIIFTIGRSISLIGDGFYLQTLIIWATSFTLAGAKTPTQQAAATVTVAAITAGIYGAYYLANLIVAPFGGVFVDRLNRRTTMITADLVQAVLATLPLGAFLVARSLFIPAIYLSFFLLTGFAGLFTSAQGGALQVIVSRRRLAQAVSILNILLGVGTVLGALFAPSFFLTVGPVVAILFNAASFIVSAISLFFLRIPDEAVNPYKYRQASEAASSSGIGPAIAGVFKDLGRGLRFTFTTRVLIAIAMLLIVAELGAGGTNAVTSSFFLVNLHANPTKDLALLGLLPAALGAGGIVGALLTGILARYLPLKMLTTVSVLFLGLVLVGTAYQSSLITGVIFFIVLGIFNSMFLVAYNALVLKITPNTIVGRVQGALLPLNLVTGYIATLVVGAFVKANATVPNPAGLFQNIFLAGGVLIAIGSVVGMVLIWNTKEELARAEKLITPPAMVMPEGISGAQEVSGEDV